MTKVVITGAYGRMGMTLLRCAEQIPTIDVVAQIDMGQDLRDVIEKADVVVDFSYHEATVRFADICATILGTFILAMASLIAKLFFGISIEGKLTEL